jgi:hypothetical protein
MQVKGGKEVMLTPGQTFYEGPDDIHVVGRNARRKFASGPDLTPKLMVYGVQDLVADLPYDVISMGYPGSVLHGLPVAEPWNLGKGWVGFNFEAAFEHPVKVVNDAAMQALGSYNRGKMLFLGLGTGRGCRSGRISMIRSSEGNPQIACMKATTRPCLERGFFASSANWNINSVD